MYLSSNKTYHDSDCVAGLELPVAKVESLEQAFQSRMSWAQPMLELLEQGFVTASIHLTFLRSLKCQ